MLLSMGRKSDKCVIKEGKEWLSRQQSLKEYLGQEQAWYTGSPGIENADKTLIVRYIWVFLLLF